MDRNGLPRNNQLADWIAYIELEVKAKLDFAHEIFSLGMSCMKIKAIATRDFRSFFNSFRNLTSSSTPWNGRPPEIRTTVPISPIELEHQHTIKEENNFFDEDVNKNESLINPDRHNPPSPPDFKRQLTSPPPPASPSENSLSHPSETTTKINVTSLTGNKISVEVKGIHGKHRGLLLMPLQPGGILLTNI